MTTILDYSKRQWSFYAFIFISPVTWLLYISIIHFPDSILWIIPHVFSFICSGVFFVIIIHKLRNHFIGKTQITRYKLFLQLLAHTLKAYLCLLPLQVLGLIVLVKTSNGSANNDPRSFLGMAMVFMFPITCIISAWMLAGYSYVIYKCNSTNSIRRSFAVLRNRWKPIAIVTTIGFCLNGFAYARQTLMPINGLVWSMLDIVPLYGSQMVIVIGTMYISTSLLELYKK